MGARPALGHSREPVIVGILATVVAVVLLVVGAQVAQRVGARHGQVGQRHAHLAPGLFGVGKWAPAAAGVAATVAANARGPPQAGRGKLGKHCKGRRRIARGVRFAVQAFAERRHRQSISLAPSASGCSQCHCLSGTAKWTGKTGLVATPVARHQVSVVVTVDAAQDGQEGANEYGESYKDHGDAGHQVVIGQVVAVHVEYDRDKVNGRAN